ncbi:MAG: hypothetical protein WCT10_03190 [Patescibacteria group bacterium]|jgi:hypothetical protein
MASQIKMIFAPGKEVSWEDFRDYPPRSIAVDGFCKGGPQFDQDRIVLNINHHEGVDRIATRSSCLQAMLLVKLGLFDGFVDENGRPCATLYLNDCDQDVALATYILLHPEQVDRPKLKHLVRIEDLMDMSGGLYPTRKRLHLMKQLNWIMRPYTKARANGKLRELDAKGMETIVKEMHRRIRLTLFNGSTEVDVDTDYDVVSEHDGWVMVRERGEAARIGMAENKVKAFVSIIAESADRRHYTIGRLSQFILFPIPKLYDDLNKAEGLGSEAKHRWGGSDTIGGSPREVGSCLTPDEVAAVIDRRLAKLRKSAASK